MVCVPDTQTIEMAVHLRSVDELNLSVRGSYSLRFYKQENVELPSNVLVKVSHGDYLPYICVWCADECVRNFEDMHVFSIAVTGFRNCHWTTGPK